jgi:hypothetical protein
MNSPSLRKRLAKELLQTELGILWKMTFWQNMYICMFVCMSGFRNVYYGLNQFVFVRESNAFFTITFLSICIIRKRHSMNTIA